MSERTLFEQDIGSLVEQWLLQMESRGWPRERLEPFLSVGVQVFADLVTILSQSDWRENAFSALRIWRFLADQMNLTLKEKTDLFLSLRDYVVTVLKERLSDEEEARRRVEETWKEGLLRLAERAEVAAESARRRYEALFRQSPDPCLLMELNKRMTVVETNEAIRKLTGYAAEELIGRSAVPLIAEEWRDAFQNSLSELKATGFVHLEELWLQHKDGSRFPVQATGLQLLLDGHPMGLWTFRGSSLIRQIQERLMHQMTEATAELKTALERERYRARQTALIAQIAARALTAFNEQAVYDVAAEALREHLEIYDVALFSVDKEKGELVLRAHSGAYQRLMEEGYRQALSEGLVGFAARTGQPVVVNDVTQDPRYLQAGEEEKATLSEMVVPIKVQGEVVGVVDLHSERKDAFDEEDLNLAKTIADQMALAIEAIRHYERVQMFRELNQQIVESLPDAVALLDEKFRVVAVNDAFCWRICQRAREFVLGVSWQEVIPQDFQTSLEKTFNLTLDQVVSAALTENREFFLPEIPFRDIWMDLRVIPVRGATRKRVMLYVRDASLRVRRIYQLQNVMEIGQAMEGTTDIDRLLYAILTAATAGPGLGFNRAFLFLYDRAENVLKPALAVGPLTAEEAYATWASLAAERKTLTDFLSASVDMDRIYNTPIMQRVRPIKIALEDDNLLVESLTRRQLIRITNPISNEKIPESLRGVLTEHEAVCVPLVVQEEPIGIILADNPFSGHPITDESLNLLRVFTASASVAIRNAQLIRDLKDSLAREQEMKQKLDLASRLAAIGDMATRIAHDLRNPLVSISSLARQVQRRVSDLNMVQRNIGLIVDEVTRLERALKDLLDFAVPKASFLAPLNLAEVIKELAEVYRPGAQVAGVELVTELPLDGALVLADRHQIERVFFNLWNNAVEAMPEGGRLTVRLWSDHQNVYVSISDTGQGIPPEQINDVFKPFFTTRKNGTGLGLAICKSIVDEHGGSLTVESELGKGTTFLIRLPIFRS
ncbi:MAG: GAF domain-containing protein [Armatimonadetes bacterium]|nr:GAF domain-containing protein [Armatimonadota bacterium]MDW8121223.1 GAF domain-containing protein [Armatimonadota bacterium]